MHRRRGEFVERSFEQVLDDGGMRRVWLKGREKIATRYLIHTAAFNLGLILRKMTGFGTPRGWADAARAAARGSDWACAAVLRAMSELSGLRILSGLHILRRFRAGASRRWTNFDLEAANSARPALAA